MKMRVRMLRRSMVEERTRRSSFHVREWRPADVFAGRHLFGTARIRDVNGLDFDRVVVVLVRARNPNNIGAVARAMHDFGFVHLRVVNEYAMPFETARSAVDASEVLARAAAFDSVAAAVADCMLVVGTTAVGERSLQHPLYVLPEAGEMIGETLRREGGRVALLFGSEKTGLSNDELSHCHWLLTVPMKGH
jgi:tRNA/rRNA methyltransferase